jgi:hypothetical protein
MYCVGAVGFFCPGADAPGTATRPAHFSGSGGGAGAGSLGTVGGSTFDDATTGAATTGTGAGDGPGEGTGEGQPLGTVGSVDMRPSLR